MREELESATMIPIFANNKSYWRRFLFIVWHFCTICGCLQQLDKLWY